MVKIPRPHLNISNFQSHVQRENYGAWCVQFGNFISTNISVLRCGLLSNEGNAKKIMRYSLDNQLGIYRFLFTWARMRPSLEKQ